MRQQQRSASPCLCLQHIADRASTTSAFERRLCDECNAIQGSCDADGTYMWLECLRQSGRAAYKATPMQESTAGVLV